jgi:hypothetical protein
MKIPIDYQLQNLNTQRLTALRESVKNGIGFRNFYTKQPPEALFLKNYLKAINKLLRTREQNEKV